MKSAIASCPSTRNTRLSELLAASPRLSRPLQRPAHHFRICDAQRRERQSRRCQTPGEALGRIPSKVNLIPFNPWPGTVMNARAGNDRALRRHIESGRLRKSRARRAAAISWRLAVSSNRPPRSCSVRTPFNACLPPSPRSGSGTRSQVFAGGALSISWSARRLVGSPK